MYEISIQIRKWREEEQKFKCVISETKITQNKPDIKKVNEYINSLADAKLQQNYNGTILHSYYNKEGNINADVEINEISSYDWLLC